VQLRPKYRTPIRSRLWLGTWAQTLELASHLAKIHDMIRRAGSAAPEQEAVGLRALGGRRQVQALPGAERSSPVDAASRVEVRVWPAVLELGAYSALSGALAMGIGQAMVSLTRVVLPPLPVRLGSIAAVVVAAGLAAEFVLERLKRLASGDHS
jgi:hypothetical protein